MKLSELKKQITEALEKYGDGDVEYSGESSTDHGQIDTLQCFSDWDDKNSKKSYYLMDSFTYGELDASDGVVAD